MKAICERASRWNAIARSKSLILLASALLILLFPTSRASLAGPRRAGAAKEAGERLSTPKLLRALKGLYATAALWQFKSRDGGMLTFTGPEGLNAVRDVYIGILAIGEILEERKLVGSDRRLLSRAYSEIAWFAYKTEQDDCFGEPALMINRRAIVLDENNALAWYEEAEMLKTTKIDKTTEERIGDDCLRCLKLDPHFPEAWLELGLHYGRIHFLPESDRARVRFLACLRTFKPELHFFDSGYPGSNEFIGLPPGRRILERKIYRTDSGRFALTWH